MNDQLDPTVVALARAIKKQETGAMKDAYNARGGSGEFGAYQYMPDTWKQWSKEFLGAENAPMSIENQNKVAYHRVKQLKDSGYTPAEVAAAWNAGEGRVKDGSWKTWTGTNKQGVKYDTPSYVKKVSEYYQQLKPVQQPLGPNEVQIPGMDKTFDFGDPQAAMKGPDANEGFMANLGDTLVNPFTKLAIAGGNLLQDAVGAPTKKSFKSPFTNKEYDVPGYKGGEEATMSETAKQYAGAGIQVAATALPFAKAGMFIKAPILSTVGLGYANDVGLNLDDGKSVGTALIPGMNTALAVPLGIFAKGVQALAKPIGAAREDVFLAGIEDLKNRTKTSDNAFNKNIITRTTDAGETTIAPTDTWMAKRAPIPTVSTEGGTATAKAQPAIDHFNELIAKSDDDLIDGLKAQGFKMSEENIRKIADQIVKNTDSIEGIGNGKTTRESVAEALANRITNLSREFGNVWDGETVRKILKAANRDFKEDTRDVSRLLGDSMREIMYNYTNNGRKALNEMQELIAARNFATAINGKKVAGGGLGRMFARGVGMTLASAAGSGPLGLLLGGEAGAAAGRLIQKGTFISVPAEIKASLLKLFKAEGASAKEIRQIEKVLKVKSEDSEAKIPINSSLRDELLSRAQKISIQNKTPAYEGYIPDAELPTIQSGPAAKSKFNKTSNLPTIRGSADTGLLTKLGAGSAAATGAVAGYNALADKLGTETYTREAEQPQAPQVVSTTKDKYGEIIKLDNGVEVRPPEKFVRAIEKAYQEFPNLPKGFLETVLMMESSMGTLGKDNNNPGKEGWLVALTKPTVNNIKLASVSDQRYKDLSSKMKFNTPEEAIRSAAAYADFRSNIYDNSGKVVDRITDPVRLYLERYHAAPSTGKMKEKEDRFRKMFDFYSQS